jgi:hypothetical protein
MRTRDGFSVRIAVIFPLIFPLILLRPEGGGVGLGERLGKRLGFHVSAQPVKFIAPRVPNCLPHTPMACARLIPLSKEPADEELRFPPR